MGSISEKRRTRKKSKAGWIVLLILLLALCAAVWWFHGAYFIAGGRPIRRDAESLDLRGHDVSEDAYAQIRENLPRAEILWDVPLSAGSADCTAEDLTLRGFEDADLARLARFTALRSLDLTEATVTPEQIEAVSAALPDCRIRWSVPVGGGRFPSDAGSIDLTALSEGEIPLFRYFENLRSVSAAECTDYSAIMALREAYPELDVSWQVNLSGKTYPQDARELLVDDPSAGVKELEEALKYLPEIKTVKAPVNNWSEAEKDALTEAWPQVTFFWPVTFRGTVYDENDRMMDLSGKAITSAEVDELVRKSSGLSGVEQIDLSGTGISLKDAKRLKEAMPRADLLFDFELFGVPINSMDTFIDFSNIEMDSVDEVESLIPLMPRLEKIDMSFCGLDNETLDAFNKRYDNVRVVWTLRISYWAIRTDDKGFRASSRYYGYFTEETIQWFKYCEDMVALDMGHRNLKDLSFLYGMPQLKYLILLHWRATDITPIGSLKNLVWLELNKLPRVSLATLKNCDSLHDLNICFTPVESQEEAFETLMAMPQLERLWYTPDQLSVKQRETLQETYPDLVMHMVLDPTEDKQDPWRFDQDYYDMRDAMNMFYMSCHARINYKIIDGVRYDLDPEFIAQQGDTTWDKTRTYQ